MYEDIHEDEDEDVRRKDKEEEYLLYEIGGGGGGGGCCNYENDENTDVNDEAENSEPARVWTVCQRAPAMSCCVRARAHL